MAQGLVEVTHHVAHDIHNGGGDVETPMLAGAISSADQLLFAGKRAPAGSPIKPKSPPEPTNGGAAKRGGAKRNLVKGKAKRS